MIVVVTGASGAGKSGVVRALDARRIDGVRCFFFDSIGVPDDAGQPELASDPTACSAAYLRGQAEALKLAAVDTTRLAIAEVADRLANEIRSATVECAP